MKETGYSEAAVEVLDILNHTNKEDVEKIPQSFIKFLVNISRKDYNPRFNHEQPINGLNLQQKTKELLGFIYITWWCDEKESEKFKNQVHEESIKKEIRKRNYSTDHILKGEDNRQTATQNISVEETSLIEYKEENRLKKFISKILSFFKNKK